MFEGTIRTADDQWPGGLMCNKRKSKKKLNDHPNQ